MRKSVLLLVALVSWSMLAPAQEEPIPPPRRAKAPKVGLFAGYTPGWLFADTKPVDAFLTGGNAAPIDAGSIFMNGGAGAIYILVVQNVRVGFMGMGGTSTNSGVFTTDVDGTPTSITKDSELNVSLGGFTFEYVLPIMPKLDVAVGTMIGWGGTQITLRQNIGGPVSWQIEQDLLRDWPDTPGTNVTRNLSGSFFTLMPAVNLEYAILSYLGVRVGVAYVAMLAPSWDLDAKYDLTGVPSDVNGSGLMIQGGIFLGTF